MSTSEPIFDAREIDAPPFADIMDAVHDLDPDETLTLINSFEPEPLYGVLEERGFTHDTEQVAGDEWHVEIEHA